MSAPPDGSTTGPGLPPTAKVELEQDSVLEYWRTRAEQHTQDSYAGVPLSKFPEDLRVYEHLLWVSAPDTVLELGTQFGASALWFRDRLRTLRSYRRIGRRPHIVSVDIDQSRAREHLARADARYSKEITLIEGDVGDPEIAEAVRKAIRRNAHCFVIEDSAHTYESTAASLEHFASYVEPGGFLVVEDGCVDVDAMRIGDDWPRGVLPALQAWRKTPLGTEFELRRDLELYGITCHPSGFLQRRLADGKLA